MKKFLIIITCIIGIYLAIDHVYYYGNYTLGFLNKTDEIQYFTKTEGEKIRLKGDKHFEDFEIRGVNMGLGIPGHFATEYAIDKDTYLRWFKYIQDMGANTIRVYTINHDDFYEAFYEYNKNNDNPLFLIHGVWVDDYIQNSHRDALDNEFIDAFREDCKTLVDIIHGRKKIRNFNGLGRQIYKRDVSEWVIGYILGIEWEDVTVSYTNRKKETKDKVTYEGKYMYTEGASAFEAMLCEIGDTIIEYESEKYGEQRLVAFSNWAITDPFDYPRDITNYFKKIAKVDVENIKTTKEFLSGQFASYHIYSYYPDYLNYMEPTEEYIDRHGKVNPYYAYLKKINEHHEMPVVISEFGVPSSRGMAQREYGSWRSQGNLSESKQGEAIISCYEDIMEAGSAGSCIFSWQDEWFKRTWNTMAHVDLAKTPYWNDYETNEQNFGLLAFDPGKERSASYVDGDIEEWNKEHMVVQTEEANISMKYDEKFIYFLVHKEGFSEEEKLYIPIDITPKSGSTSIHGLDFTSDRGMDFLITINGKDNSRVMVQERYDVNRALNLKLIEGIDAFTNPPAKDSVKFRYINLMLQTAMDLIYKDSPKNVVEVYETGKLVHGNANPNSSDFNSLADFCINGDFIEIKLPWQLLNFSNPSEMMIHDDYYEKYGVENLKINEMYVGITTNKKGNVDMKSFDLEPWGKKVTYHERLKKSYYIVKDYWNNN